MHRQAPDFPVFILYPAIADSVYQLSELSGWSPQCVLAVESAKKQALASSFRMCIPVFSFPSLAGLAHSSRAVLSNNKEHGCLCLTPDVSANALRSSPFDTTLTEGLLFIAFSVF